ncbi:MAG: hypothetical protein HY316_09455 [Acidobacteria bacterium]|nr:hypothetical protein [Acidobacteriota bacterium]
MISSKRISLALAALVLVVLAGAGSAFAQTVTFNVSTAPTFVANTGRSEVMGQVTMSADFTCSPGGLALEPDGFCVSTAGTIQVLYVGTPIDNNLATAGINTLTTNGIEVCERIAAVTTCNATGTYLAGGVGGFTITNTTAGGVVSFGVLGLIDFAAGDQLLVRGVRGQIDLGPGNVVGTSIIGQLTSSPSTIAGFQPTSEVVARSADPLTMAFAAWNILQCLPLIGSGTVTVTEGFNTAFVDHDVDPADGTAGTTTNLRPRFSPTGIGGATRTTRNSRINIVLTGKPTGVTITWPQTSAADSGGGVTLAFLNKVSQSTSGDNVLYAYSAVNQAASDINGERFVITVTAALNVALSGTSSDFGTSTGQGQMFDAATATSQPRYNHPLEPVPGQTWLTVAPCTTNLLYSWVLNFAGLDTGIAISNTSADPYGTINQNGTCTVNLWPTVQTTNNGVSVSHPPAAVSITTATVEAGSVWRATMSGTPTFAGLAGYIIAVCRFQYGHGFAFITDNFGVGAPGTAQGYLANIIPDPVLLGGRVATQMAEPGQAPVGEGLGQ